MTGGKKNYYKQIINFLEKNNLKNVKYLGKVNIKDYIKIFNNADFLIEPTYYTSSSLPILEAAALKKNIIASDIPVLREMGKIFKIHFFNLKKKNLSKIIKKILKNNQDKTKNFNFIMSKNFSWNIIAKNYLELLKNLK